MTRLAILMCLLTSTFVAVLASGAVPGIADDGLEVEVVSVEDAEFPAMTAVISVESAGRPVPTLLTTDITVTDNGAPVTVKRVTLAQDANIPTTVVATLDTSGSMLGDKLARAKEALSGLVLRLAATDRVALLSFSDKAQVVTQPTTDKSGVGAAVAALQAAGNTALYGAVAESANVAASSGGARRLVILLSDGEEFGNVSGLTREESLERAAASGAIFYVIGLGVGADRDYLVQLAARTGGRYLDAPTTSDIQAGYAAIEATLRGQFVLSLESTAPSVPMSRSISVKVSKGVSSGSTTFALESTRPAPVAQPAAPAATTSTPQAEAQQPVTSAPSSAGSSVGWLWPLLLLTALALAGIAWITIRRMRPAAEATNNVPQGDSLPTEAQTGAVAAHAPVSAARLLRKASPEGISVPETLALPREPVSIGWSSECNISLPRAAGLAPVHARLWWRDGTVMLHHLGAGTTTLNGTPAQWASLAEGDSICFGPFQYQYSMKSDPGADRDRS